MLRYFESEGRVRCGTVPTRRGATPRTVPHPVTQTIPLAIGISLSMRRDRRRQRRFVMGMGVVMGDLPQEAPGERGIYFSRIQYASGGDKELKTRTIQARMQHHRVLFPRSAPWL